METTSNVHEGTEEVNSSVHAKNDCTFIKHVMLRVRN